MNVSRRVLLGTAAAASVPLARARGNQPTIKIGVLTDMSGPYKEFHGPTAVVCAQQAIADFGSSGRQFGAEIIVGDHQNKPDIGAGIAREWFDRDGVDMIVGVPHSGVALAVQSAAG